MRTLVKRDPPKPPSWVGRVVDCRRCRSSLLVTREDDVQHNQIVCPECGHSFPVGTDPTIYPTVERIGG